MPNMRLLPLLLAATTATASYMNRASKCASCHRTASHSGDPKRAEQPCAQVSQSLAALDPTATPRSVPAKVAYDCLMSVPVDVEGDVLQIQELKAFMEWQSNLAWLKQDIPWHHPKPVDILGGLDHIAQSVQNGAYQSDYEVQTAISDLLTSSYDNHLGFQSDIGTIFSFQKFGARLVSVSKEGVALPELFLFSDVQAVRNGSNSPISSVKTINGKVAVDFLNQLALEEQNHDPDARYNALFPNPAGMSIGQYRLGGFVGSSSYPGETTMIGFTNGTTKSFPNIAIVAPKSEEFTGVTDGKSFFETFCSGPPDRKSSPTPTPTAPAQKTTTPVLKPTGYPKPAYIHSELAVGGYYLNGTGYDDVAVLSIPTYDTEEPLEFQNVIRKFLADAVAKNKKKLIVDLRYNGGGTIGLGFDTFKQLFPTVVPYGAARYRAHDATSIISAAVADFIANHTIAEENNDFYFETLESLRIFDWAVYLDVNNTSFETYEEFYGPTAINGDEFQSIRRYNIASAVLSQASIQRAISATSVTPPQPFTADSIVILQDGRCASTCTIFSELMREQGHVQTVVIGGRPSNGVMQGIGGTRGSQVLALNTLHTFAQSALTNVVPAINDGALLDRVNSSVVGTLAYPMQLVTRSNHDKYPTEVIAGAINSLNNLRQNDTSETPLEFVYEAADCRIFYTADGYFDPTHIWKQVADVKWGNGNCVEGSIGDKSAIGVVRKEPFNVKTPGSNVEAPKQTQDPNKPVPSQGAGSELRVRGVVLGLAVMIAGAAMVL